MKHQNQGRDRALLSGGNIFCLHSWDGANILRGLLSSTNEPRQCSGKPSDAPGWTARILRAASTILLGFPYCSFRNEPPVSPSTNEPPCREHPSLCNRSSRQEKGHGDLFADTIPFLCWEDAYLWGWGVPAKLHHLYQVLRGYKDLTLPPAALLSNSLHRQSDAPIVFAKSIAVPLPHDASKHRLEPAEAIERHSHEGHTRNTLVTGKGIS